MKLTSADRAVVRRVVNRCHVSDSTRDVLRYLKSRMRRGDWKKLPRSTRREIMRVAFDQHANNFVAFAYVVGGR